MKASGWSASEVAGKLGFSNATVTRLLSLISLPDAIQGKVASGDIPASAAYELSHVTDAGMQAELAGRVAAGELTRDGIRAAAAGGKKRLAKLAKASRVTAKVAPGLSVTVSAAAVNLAGLINSLDVLVAKARELQGQGADVRAFLKTLKSPAKPTKGGAA
jgi:ParB-like chromosome segregation protein Spo0J